MIKCPMCKGKGKVKELETLEHKRKHIFELRDKGYSIRAIARVLGVAHGTVHYHLQRRG